MRVGLFPGQGVQASGLADGLVASAADVFAEASDALGVDVVELCRTGRSGLADVASTRWAQPAIVTAGVAAFRVLERGGHVHDGVCGHSLGEYTALVAAGCLGLGPALALVALRAETMERAATASPGGMLAVGADLDVVEAVCAETGVGIAGDNAPGQVVVSGPADALDRAAALFESRDVRSKRLKVAGPFHSPAMASAAAELQPALERITFAPPQRVVWSSTTADRVDDPETIRSILLAQLTGPVRFRETLLAVLDAGAVELCDFGPGRVLAGLVRRIAPALRCATADEAFAVGAMR